ncbi:MAG: GNAT family N-acetyltransferase [Xenococcaceae cyanobacterium]
MTTITIKTVEYLAAIEPIRAIRTEVFQIEQKVAEELEFDGLDETAIHLLAYLENRPVGTARIRKIDNKTAKIERLSVLPKVRNKGIGKQLMVKAIEIITAQNYQKIVIHAQEYIKSLYQKLGFKQIGDTFEEANIHHVKMVKTLTENI